MTEEHENKETMKIKKITIWKILSGIFGALLVISIFTSGFNINSVSAIKLSDSQKNKIANNALNSINNNILAAQGTSATLNKVTEENGLIKLDLTIQDQNLESYVTKDGKYLFPQAIDLTQSAPSQAQPSAQQANNDFGSLIDDDAIEGDADAPVTIVEFSDYECPYCARFYSQTLGQIREQYIDTGKVKLVYRDFPLSFHKQAQKAAEAAECAGEQGKYYDMHDKLFEEGVSGGIASFKQYAADIGLDASKFNDCLDSGKMASEIAKDMQDGSAAGISGTPGFIINGQLVSGAQPFNVFQQIIDAELAK